MNKKEVSTKVDFGSYDLNKEWFGNFCCPKCFVHLSPYLDSNINYCFSCGQKLDWNLTWEYVLKEINKNDI